MQGAGFDPWVGKTPWRREWLPTPVFLPGEFHGQRRLVGYSSWGSQRVGHDRMTYTYTYIPPPPSWTSLTPPPHRTLAGHHRAPSWAPCAVQQAPIRYLFHTWQCICISATLPMPPTHSVHHCVHLSLLYVCISIPALWTGPSVPFF